MSNQKIRKVANATGTLSVVANEARCNITILNEGEVVLPGKTVGFAMSQKHAITFFTKVLQDLVGESDD